MILVQFFIICFRLSNLVAFRKFRVDALNEAFMSKLKSPIRIVSELQSGKLVNILSRFRINNFGSYPGGL